MTFRMSNTVYDILCWIARVVLPALGTFYFALAEIWKLPYAAEVIGTISALTTFLAVILGISSAQYHAEKDPAIKQEDFCKDCEVDYGNN